MTDPQDEARIQDERDAADDAELQAELEGRGDDLLDRERRERDIWGPHPDDLIPWAKDYEYPIARKAS